MKAIVCYDVLTRGIGKDGCMLFNFNEDMEHFKAITDGKIVIMGTTTYNSLMFRPLPNRMCIVITRHPEDHVKSDKDMNGTIFMTMESFVFMYDNMENTDNFIVIGGEQIYKQLLPFCDEVCAVEVYSKARQYPDTFFPDLPQRYWKKQNYNMFLCNHSGCEAYATPYVRKYVEQVAIPRLTTVGQISLNNVIYNISSYRKALNDFKERSKFMFGSKDLNYPGEIYIPCEILRGKDANYSNWTEARFNIIDPSNSCGTRLVGLTDTHCILEFSDKDLCEEIKALKEDNKTRIGMRYIANVSPIEHTLIHQADITRIIAFDLIIDDWDEVRRKHNE